MRILMLGMNAASQMSITVRALRQIGADVEGLLYDDNPVIVSNDGLRNLAHGMSRRERLRAGFLRTSYSYSVLEGIAKADVIHWNYGLPVLRDGLDVRLAGLLGRPGVVEFWGSDVRIRDIAAAHNPYYARRGATYEYENQETRESSYARQRAFAHHGVRACLGPPWFDKYLEPGLFSEMHLSFARLFVDEFPVAPNRNSGPPLLVHAPSARGAKGTDAVVEAVDRLKQKFEFEFVLLHGMPRAKVLEMMRDCDIFLDQFVLGEYGMASLEAMAFGRPVVCYLSKEVMERSPGHMPIVNATVDDLYERVAELLGDQERRRAIGAESRLYIEQHHNAITHAHRLVGVYEGLVASGSKGRSSKRFVATPHNAPAAASAGVVSEDSR